MATKPQRSTETSRDADAVLAALDVTDRLLRDGFPKAGAAEADLNAVKRGDEVVTRLYDASGSDDHYLAHLLFRCVVARLTGGPAVYADLMNDIAMAQASALIRAKLAAA